MKKNPARTSLRSLTQATDSTRNGCTANTAATKAAGARAPVAFASATQNNAAPAACSSALVTW
jgi:hypothetical protein